MKLINIKHSFGVSEIEIDDDNHFTGNGTVYYDDGRKYSGQINEEGLPFGNGIFTFENNDTLEGKFKQNGSLVGIGRYNSSKTFAHKTIYKLEKVR
ncbi:MAG: hypothetical protein IJZ29_03025 [Clostridia bacterium]|nr:hypothetical protein [Clostridia bacterium]